MNTAGKYKIGVDIGGTNTDAILLNEKGEIVSSYKTPTEKPLVAGVGKGIAHLLKSGGIAPAALKGIYVGTTHALNALLEAKGLFKVGVLRLAGHRPATLPPCFKWPARIKEAAFAGVATVDGGLRCDQKELTPLSRIGVKEAVGRLLQLGMESLVIVGVFSPLSPAQELDAAAAAAEVAGTRFPITCSSAIGGMGFIERENASILNAALKKPLSEAFQQMEAMKRRLAIDAPLFLTQNDGSILDVQQAVDKPLLTIASGPTNSFIGGAKLAAVHDAIVVDIGGTSTDIGIVLNGYPRRSLSRSHAGGIPLNFRMPDVISLPIGGGSLVRRTAGGFTCGPESIGPRLFTDGCLFGGNTLTLTDAVCMALGRLNGAPPPLTQHEAAGIFGNVLARVKDSIRVMRGRHKDLPVVAVGGGAYFLQGTADIMPANSDVANAYGAALAEISYTVDTVTSLAQRDSSLAAICEEARRGATGKGACEQSTRIVDMQIMPYNYVPNQMARVVATASGKMR